MEKIKGRSDDMLKIRGVNVFPTQIESVLMSQPHICLLYTSGVVAHGGVEKGVTLSESRRLL